ncbi:uncharacterized protein Tco025E_07301 [Trypanosoma conorhini]|uniref:Uncharacterized protein n=1 Tax=Trypanosoma conorhini TaxID=83891 RepID=A0A422NQR2_9TRYP|nr:uncharacterized protein Tco025E_07301 [Trypanosoma conorhini]RNF07850.1 hypothetical protein Tco025E_07301 [Trypanosoma conorhini]
MPELPVAAAPSSDASRQEATSFRVKLGDAAHAAPGTARDKASTADRGRHAPPPSSGLGAAGVAPTEMEFAARVTLVNALSEAYTSTGYPTVANSNTPHASVYGAFVELRNPSLRSLTLPPDETLVVDPPTQRSRDSGAGTCRPLLRVVWKRGSHLFDARAATAAAAAGATPKLSSLCSPKTPACFVPPRAAPAASLRHLQQFPDGIHDVQTSPRMSGLLLGLPQTVATPSCAPRATSPVDGVVSSTNGTRPGEEGDRAEKNTPAAPRSRPQPPFSPPEEPPLESAPVQLTLVTASSFNHLTTYAVKHQGGSVLAAVPLQTLVASLTPRRITAHCPFLLGTTVGETYTPPGLPIDAAQHTLRGGEPKEPSNSFMFRKPANLTAQGSPEGIELLLERNRAAWARGDDGDAMAVATECIAVEPFILIGNQGGDLLIFSMFERKVVQRLNFAGGVSGGSSGDAASVTPKQVVNVPVSCITELECGLEKLLTLMFERAGMRRTRDGNGFTSPFGNTEGFPPSVFAVGFANGQVLLVCVTLEGAWLSRLLSSFGHRPVQAIAMQLPHFLKRLWSEDAAAMPVAWAPPPPPERRREKGSFPASVTCVTAETLLAGEDGGIAAISCNGGTLRLVKALDIEAELCQITAFENNSAGGFLAVQWIPSHADAALCPDLLVATNEDDSITVYQLSHLGGRNKNGSGRPNRASKALLMEDLEVMSPVLQTLSFVAYSQAVKDGVVRVARRCFHRSWVGDLCALPLPSRGHLLVATSYDGRSSFWPLCCEDAASSADAPDATPLHTVEPHIQECFHGCFHQDANGACVIPQRLDDCISAEPSAAVTLHTDHTVRCIACGAGRNQFLVSLCLRGRVKFWEVRAVSK